ncbi:MAG: hypothetical protein ACJ79K_16795 [Gemmatimonadaceae bacterium]
MRGPALVIGAILLASPAWAQRVPGRDLLDFPLGALAEPPVMASADVALWNAANIIPTAGNRGRIGFASVQTPTDLGISVVGLSLAAALPQHLAAAVSAVQGSVAGIPRTTTDPSTLAGDVSYNTTMFSAGFARRTENVTAGLAVRYRMGSVDTERRSAFGVDGGLLADSLFGLPIRGAASTFLWRPANGADEETAYSGALDARLFQVDSTLEARGGYALTLIEQRTVEHYVFAGAASKRLEVRVGLARHQSSGENEWSLRLGTGLQYGRYHIGVAREGARDGLGGIYQFTLTTLIR